MIHHKIISTDDGSSTIFSERFQATYHSEKGAVTESNVVFITAGLQFRTKHQKTTIKIFEMGFGTGLNAILSFIFSEANKIPVSYQSIEAFPLDREIWSSLDYSLTESSHHVFRYMHESPWNEKIQLSPTFSLHKTLGKMEDFHTSDKFDIIFYDAFAPRTQPDLWDDTIVHKMADMLVQGGILTTYCAQGEFRRCLRRHGFSNESLSGPPGKREITRATKL